MVTASLAGTFDELRKKECSVADVHAERTERIRLAIIRHLQRFPRAADTPEGMVASWLPSVGYEDALPAIGAVVEIMVQAKELTPRSLPDGSILFVRGPALPLR